MISSIIGNQQSQSKAPETWESRHIGASLLLNTPPPQESGYFCASHADGRNSLSHEYLLSMGNPLLSNAEDQRKHLTPTLHLRGGPSQTKHLHGLTQS